MAFFFIFIIFCVEVFNEVSQVRPVKLCELVPSALQPFGAFRLLFGHSHALPGILCTPDIDSPFVGTACENVDIFDRSISAESRREGCLRKDVFDAVLLKKLKFKCFQKYIGFSL